MGVTIDEILVGDPPRGVGGRRLHRRRRRQLPHRHGPRPARRPRRRQADPRLVAARHAHRARSPTGRSTACPPPQSDATPAEPAAHANGATYIDHVVLLTPDLARTTEALGAIGLTPRGERDSDTYGAPMRQVFFRLGEVILELIGQPDTAGEGDPGFFGLADHRRRPRRRRRAARRAPRASQGRGAGGPAHRHPPPPRAGHERGHRFMSPGADDRASSLRPSAAGDGSVGHPCWTTSSPMPSARCATPSRRRSSSGRRSRSGSRSTCCSATRPGRRPTASPARASRRGCRPTSPSTGPRGRRPPTGPGTSASPPTRRRASRSRS